MSDYELTVPNSKDWNSISDLIAKSIPNTIVSHLGRKFGAIYYKSIASCECSCVYIYADKSDGIKGVIIGTIDHSTSYSEIKKNIIKLLAAMNFRIFKPFVIKWIFSNIFSKIAKSKSNHSFLLSAELIAIAVSPDVRGKGVADKLIQKWEDFIIYESQENEYYILTEKDNERANKYYKKIGADYITTFISRGRRINRWHKTIDR
jgi:GNAT superfamily N-acetyltransferase